MASPDLHTGVVEGLHACVYLAVVELLEDALDVCHWASVAPFCAYRVGSSKRRPSSVRQTLCPPPSLSTPCHRVVLPMPQELLYVAGSRPWPFPRGADPGLQSATMNDIASWLRAQISSSTDPGRLERLARQAERQAALRSGIATIVKKRTPSKPPPGNNPSSVEGQRCPSDEARPQLVSIGPATYM